MPTPAWPAVKSALAAGAQTLPEFSDASVFIGPQASRTAATKKLEVGFVNGEDNAGTFEQSLAYDGSVWSEVGDVRSTIVAQSGSADPSGAEADAFAMAGALVDWIHSDTTLGDVLSEEAEIRTSVDVLSISNTRGTATELVLTLTYTTTL